MPLRMVVDWDLTLIQQVRLAHSLAEGACEVVLPATELRKLPLLQSALSASTRGRRFPFRAWDVDNFRELQGASGR